MLGDPDKRRRYDAYGHAGVSGAAGGAGFDPTIFADFSDILGDFFGFGDAFGRRRGPRRGADLRYNLDLSFEEAAFGTEAQIRIPRAERCADLLGQRAPRPGTEPVTCPTCRGARAGHVPAGLLQRRAAPAATAAAAGGSWPSPARRAAARASACVERTLTDQDPRRASTTAASSASAARASRARSAALRATSTSCCTWPSTTSSSATAPTSSARCRSASRRRRSAPPSRCRRSTAARPSSTIPEGTQSGTVLKLKGQGVPALGGRGRGDLHVLVRVVVPHAPELGAAPALRAARQDAAGARPQGQGQVAARPDEGLPRLTAPGGSLCMRCA